MNSRKIKEQAQGTRERNVILILETLYKNSFVFRIIFQR